MAKKNQRIDSDDDAAIRSCVDWNEDWETEQDIRAQWDEIHQAIHQNNAEHLDDLLPPINLYFSKEKYWSCNFYRRKYIGGQDILLQAIILQHSACVDVILDKICSGDLPLDIVDYVDLRTSRSSLEIACERDDLDLVRKLVERGHARALASRAFFIAFERGNETIMNCLAARCNVQQKDHLGRTTLDYAVRAGYMEVIKTLICHGEIGRNRVGFSPLMLMAHCNLTSFVDLLFERLPYQEAVDELVLLACHYTIAGDVPNYQKAFDYFTRGLNEEESAQVITLNEAYECRRECQTLEQLLAIRHDENALRMHALLASERILLRLGDIDLLLKFINRQCNVYRRSESFHRSLQLRIHAHQIALYTQIDRDIFLEWHRNHFDELLIDLSEAWSETDTVPIGSIEMVATLLLDNDECYNLRHTFNLLATVVNMIETVKTNSHERRSLLAVAQRVVHHNTMGRSVLNCYIQRYAMDTSVHELPLYNVSTLSVIQLMIRCGANVDGASNDRSSVRPLHVIATCSDIDISKPVIELLLSHGAHIDCIDGRGNLPYALASEPAIKELLRPTRSLSLKCRCAQIIVSTRINYQNYLSSNLSSFVRLHVATETN
ncbi:unnamed protein product [Adineta ricciae]|uniref:Uncharacterized protein n=1 Tax=Adineta ricciae TaxID=249248 RepID=A0A814C5R1_ADIRI|nr:unnamed protein product [Adineta ricciae]CAF1111689.1 unnamed protein product [Adineta ricciae]